MRYLMTTFMVMVVMAAIPAAGYAVGPRYDIVELPTIGVAPNLPRSINNHGVIVGELSLPSGRQGYVFEAGQLRELDRLPNKSDSVAYDVNDLGQIVGSSGDRAVIWEPGQPARALFDTVPPAEAIAINDQGVVTGREDNAFVFTPPSTLRRIGTLGGSYSVASDINNLGEVVGVTRDSSQSDRAFTWNTAQGFRNIGTADIYSSANAVNDRSQVAGVSTGGSEQAFVWEAATGMRNLGRPLWAGGVPTGINNRGVIVGSSLGGTFIWQRGWEMQDLNALLPEGSNWDLVTANAINDAGQIVGTAFNDAGNLVAYLMTPQSLIPEPEVIAHTDFAEPSPGARTFTPSAAQRELGFATTVIDNGGQLPMAGVANNTAIPPSQHFVVQSVNSTTTFADVDLTSWQSVRVSLIMNVKLATYEAGDFIRAFVTDGTNTIDLVNLEGANTANDPLERRSNHLFITYSADIPDEWTHARLVVATSSSAAAGAERFEIDNVVFGGIAIPEPSTSSLALISVAFVGIARVACRGRDGWHGWLNPPVPCPEQALHSRKPWSHHSRTSLD